jgi:hypothetical protein
MVLVLIGGAAGGVMWWLRARAELKDASFRDARLGATSVSVNARSLSREAIGARVGAIVERAKCEAATPKRVGALLDSFPEWADGSLSRIACRRISRSMSREQLRAAWGPPRNVTIERGGRVETWYFGGDTSVIMVDNRIRSWFGGGKNHE